MIDLLRCHCPVCAGRCPYTPAIFAICTRCRVGPMHPGRRRK